MPLHKIPLCNFKYVRDIRSSATFEYDFTHKIQTQKTETQLVSDKIIEIDKFDSKLIYKEGQQIDKINSKLMYNEDHQINKSINTLGLIDEFKNINISDNISELEFNDRLIHKDFGNKPLNGSIINIGKCKSKELDKQSQVEFECQKSNSLECITSLELNMNDNIKNLRLPELGSLNKSNDVILSVNRELNISKVKEINLDGKSSIDMDKHLNVYIERNNEFNINIDAVRYFYESVSDTTINKVDFKSYLHRVDTSNIDYFKHNKSLSILSDLRDIHKIDPVRMYDISRILTINMDTVSKLVKKIDVNTLNKCTDKVSLDLLQLTHIDKDKSNRLFYRYNINTIDKINNDKLVDRLTIKNVFKIRENHLDRIDLTNMFKLKEKYSERIVNWDIFKLDAIGLNDVAITPILKEYQKPVLNLTIENIYKDQSRSLNGTYINEINLPYDRKFIEITKRWWWLDSKGPKDHLILPNTDYGKMSGLLSNPNYEYLRYDNHPIEWGNTWGIDWSIPSDSISIEIMVDLANIITMVWHKNVQGWLNVSGKESIQLLMELLHSWYTLDTSKPNKSYYRAYRWVRWEAEKVYFLNTKNGLQAIGILVANLRNYLKIHHFNYVPLWRNPKAMDEERNYNRIATNGDLMRDLNKNKGNRHYLIETQNFERKTKLRR